MAIESHKNVFARLLACENITIVHESVQTASFDVKNRILSLPIWKDVSADVYDLLIAHEVGHALFTPLDETIEVSKKYDSNFFHNYLNPIEDLRIEKLIKQKYGGLRRQFSSGYRELWENDFFGVGKFKTSTGKNINKMSILDRLHIYGKVGALSGITFNSAEEQSLLAQAESMISFDDAVKLALKLADHKNQNQNGEGESQNQNGEGESQNQNGEGEGESQNQNGEGESQNQNGEGESQNQNGEGVGRQNNFSDYETSVHSVAALQNSLNDLIDTVSPSPIYATVPDFDFSNVIIDVKDVLEDVSNFYKLNPKHASPKEYNEFKNSSKKVVGLMLKEFELKKRADEYRRTTTSRTGVIDMRLLHKYKTSEDIFNRSSNTKDGKSHGFVSILDWSGSMSRMIIPTTEQLLVMAQFFKKANVPFEIFLFTDSHSKNVNLRKKNPHITNRKLEDVEFQYNFCLPNVLSSRLNAKDFYAACLNLYNLAQGVASQYGRNNIKHIDYFSSAKPAPDYNLGGTPLNESIVALKYIVNKFREDSGSQIVNTIIMTDGLAGRISTSNSGLYAKNRFLVEGKENFGELGTSALLKWLKYHTNSNIIGFYLINRKTTIDGTYSPRDVKLKDEWYGHMKKYDFASAKIDGYDEHYTIRTSKVSDDDNFEVDAGASGKVVGMKFVNHMIDRKKSRLLAERFVDRIVS